MVDEIGDTCRTDAERTKVVDESGNAAQLHFSYDAALTDGKVRLILDKHGLTCTATIPMMHSTLYKVAVVHGFKTKRYLDAASEIRRTFNAQDVRVENDTYHVNLEVTW